MFRILFGNRDPDFTSGLSGLERRRPKNESRHAPHQN